MKMLDRRRDPVNFGISYNHPRLREIAKGADPIPLTCTEEVAAKVAKQFNGEVCRVKPGEYKRSPNSAVNVLHGCQGAGQRSVRGFGHRRRPSILDTAPGGRVVRRRDLFRGKCQYHRRPDRAAGLYRLDPLPIPRYRHALESAIFGDTNSSKAVSSGDCLTPGRLTGGRHREQYCQPELLAPPDHRIYSAACLPTSQPPARQMLLAQIFGAILQRRRKRIVPAVEEPEHRDDGEDLDDLLV